MIANFKVDMSEVSVLPSNAELELSGTLFLEGKRVLLRRLKMSNLWAYFKSEVH